MTETPGRRQRSEEDPGRAAERTTLARSRSGLALAAAAVLLLKTALETRVPALACAIGVPAVLTAAIAWSRWGGAYERDRRALAESRTVTRPGDLQLLAAATVAMGLAALAVSLLSL